jgi:putative intracellular protease/amidase
MTKIVTILTEGFADWETTMLNAVARSYYKVETVYATPGGAPVTSSGGMKVTPDLAAEDVKPADFDAVIVCGGTAWRSANPPEIAGLMRATRDAGIVLGLICDAAWAAARAGILDDVHHTSNGPGYLDPSAYKGAALYRDTTGAVDDRRVVTAAGTSPVPFMTAVMEGLGLADENLAYYVGLHAAQYRAA